MTVTLLPAASGDYEFARETYYATMRWIIERLFGWDQIEQDASFARQFKLGEVRLIMADGVRAGWIQTQTGETSITLGQFYIIPALQRRGIGTQVLRMVIRAAHDQGKSIIVPVVKFNPAKRLYDRHGFRIAREDEYKYYMQLDHGRTLPGCQTPR
jgi:ribosomal protein S18 acetylase RimI-like enzyme